MKCSLLLIMVSLVVLMWSCSPGMTITGTPVAGGTQRPAPKASAPQAAGGWDQTVAEARKEGRVTLYAEITPELRAVLTRALKDKYGIELEVVSGRALEVAQKYLAEVQSDVNLADILMLGQITTITVIKPKGVLAPLAPLLALPEVKDPKAWKDGRVPFLDKDETAVSLLASYRSFIVFSTEMATARDFQSYQDLLQPKWKSKIIFNDPTVTGSGPSFVAFMLNKVLGMEGGTRFLRQIALQEPVITRDARFQVESVAKGKYPVALAPSSGVVAEFQRVGAPIEWARPKEGGMVIPGAAVISMPRKPVHPNAAAVFLNWLLTREGQTALVKGQGQPARRVDVSNENVTDPAVIPPEGVKVIMVDEEQVLLESKLMALSREIFGPLMK